MRYWLTPYHYLPIACNNKKENCKVGIVIEKDDYGHYAFCPELEGCQTQGDSLEEVRANIKETIELYCETLSQDEKTYT